MNPNAIPKEAHHDIIEDVDYLPPMSNKERKRMLAREHNRAYTAGELTRQPDLTEIVRDAVGFASKSLGL
jgi:hypothetical protein